MRICLGLPCDCLSYKSKKGFVADILSLFYEESLGGVPGGGGGPRLRGKGCGHKGSKVFHKLNHSGQGTNVLLTSKSRIQKGL